MTQDHFVIFGLYRNRLYVASALKQLEKNGFDSEAVFEIVVHNGDVLISIHTFGVYEGDIAEEILESTGAQTISKVRRAPRQLKTTPSVRPFPDLCST